MKVCILGSGAWGTALSIAAYNNNNNVSLWTHSEKEYEYMIKTRESSMLAGITLSEDIHISKNMDIARDADIVILAIPSFAVNSVSKDLSRILAENTIIVNVAKGLDKENGFCRFSETINRNCPKNKVVILTGPTHAEEVGRNMPSAILASSSDISVAEKVQDALMSKFLRVYTGDDIIGAELGGAFKNIIALAVGACDGLGFGDNSRAALMTRGLNEIAALGVALGASSKTFAGLSGVGDLIVTCTSQHSRNRRAGYYIGKGMSVEAALKEVGAVVEGYYASEAGYILSRRMNISMPLIESVYSVLYDGAPILKILDYLMSRDKRQEIEDLWG